MEAWQASQQVARVPPGAVGNLRLTGGKKGSRGESRLQGEDGGREARGDVRQGWVSREKTGDCERERRCLEKREEEEGRREGSRGANGGVRSPPRVGSPCPVCWSRGGRAPREAPLLGLSLQASGDPRGWETESERFCSRQGTEGCVSRVPRPLAGEEEGWGRG